MKGTHVAPYAINFTPNGTELVSMNQGLQIKPSKNGTTISLAAASVSTNDTVEEKTGFFSKFDLFGKKEAERIVSDFRTAKETLVKVELECRTAGAMTKRAIRDLLSDEERKLINKLKDLI